MVSNGSFNVPVTGANSKVLRNIVPFRFIKLPTNMANNEIGYLKK